MTHLQHRRPIRVRSLRGLTVITLMVVAIPGCSGSPEAARKVGPRMPHAPSKLAADGLPDALCRLGRQLRRGHDDVYETYSAAIHDPLHGLMNRRLDSGDELALKLVRAENALELALLSDRPSQEKTRRLSRVVRLTVRLLGRGRSSC